MRSRQLVAGLVALGVLTVWLYALGQRLPYMDQIPVFDADATTAEAHMWARMWWDEGPFKLWFSTPRAPASIETPTMVARAIYDSWPTGAFVPIYLVAKLLGMEPSIPMVNWINVVLHGLIALTVAFIALRLARLNRLGNLSSGLIALGVSFPILLSRGLVYSFSQIYDVVTAVLIYTAIFMLLEVLFYGARSQRDRRIVTALQLTTIFCAFFVDWLSYILFAFWMVSRFVAGYLGMERRLTFRRLIGLSLIPICAFSLYLAWRFLAPGSSAVSHGLLHSIRQLGFKILQRMNLTHESPITGFGEVFFQAMHEDYYSRFAFPLIAASALITLVLLIAAFRRASEPSERRSVFVTASILMMTIVPFYGHMFLFYEHTFIHRWAITKAMFAYSLIPFALLPIAIFTFVRQLAVQGNGILRKSGLAVMGLLLAIGGLSGAVEITRLQERPFLLGRVDRERYLMWDDIGRNTRYEDVVVSPVLEAGPISGEIGASYKLVHRADNFAEADKVVEKVCGDFNVVVALPKGTRPGEFASREPTQVVDTGRMRLLRFLSYEGKAIGCR